MPQSPLGKVLDHLRKTWAADAIRDLNDQELLQRFIGNRDQAAFTVLVQRHGPMVLSICRRVVGDLHAAEDAFQATFMVLVRRARSIRRKSLLGGWLYGVALHVALKAKAQSAARCRRERQFTAMTPAQPLDNLLSQELREVLDDEVDRLPEKYRTAIILCYFQGKSHEQAAQELGLPKRTVTSRLGRGRELLRQQLTKRGLALSAGMMATALGENVSASPIGALLIINTVKSAVSMAGSKAVSAGCISVAAAALAEEAIKEMIGVKTTLLVVALILGLAVGGAALAGIGAMRQPSRAVTSDKPQAFAPKAEQAGKNEKSLLSAADLYGDPLPKGAMARLGTERLRHGYRTYNLAFTPDSKVLASAGWGRPDPVRLWDVASGRALRSPSLPLDAGNFAFSPDGKWLVKGGHRGVILLDVATNKEVRRLTPAAGVSLTGVAFSPDGRTVACRESGAARHALILWDASTGQVIRRIEGGIADYIQSFAFSPDGKALASACQGLWVRLWNVATGEEIRKIDDDRLVYTVLFSPNGKILLTASPNDGAVRLWDVATGKLLHVLNGNDDFTPVAFAPNCKVLASAKGNGTICFWDPETGKEIRKWVAATKGLRALAFSPDGKVLASSAMYDGAIRLWDPATGKEINPPVGHTGGIDTLLYAADGKTLLSCGQDWKTLEWDLATGRLHRQLLAGPPSPAEQEHARTTFVLSSDGKYLAWAGLTDDPEKREPFIHRMDLAMGKQLLPLIGHKDEVKLLRISPNGRLLAAVDKGTTRLWDLEAGKEILQIPGTIGCLAFSPDNTLLALAANEDKAVLVLDVATTKQLHRWDMQTNNPNLMLFSPDGKLLVAGGDESVQVWTVDTGNERWRFPGSEVSAFSPSGRTLASNERSWRTLPNGDTYSQWSIHIRDMLTGQEICQIENPQGVVWSLAFAPDGQTLASGGAESSILIWDVTGIKASGKWKAAPLTAQQLDNLWSDLAGEAPAAERALWQLALTPAQGMPYLSQRLKLLPNAPAAEVARLIGELDNERFTVRQKASQTLEAMGESVEAALRKALKDNLTLELRQRVEKLLDKRDQAVIRDLRAIEAVEHIGNSNGGCS